MNPLYWCELVRNHLNVKETEISQFIGFPAAFRGSVLQLENKSVPSWPSKLPLSRGLPGSGLRCSMTRERHAGNKYEVGGVEPCTCLWLWHVNGAGHVMQQNVAMAFSETRDGFPAASQDPAATVSVDVSLRGCASLSSPSARLCSQLWSCRVSTCERLTADLLSLFCVLALIKREETNERSKRSGTQTESC